MKVNDENRRIRIRIRIRIYKSEAWIRGSASASGSTPKCHGSATLIGNVVFVLSVFRTVHLVAKVTKLFKIILLQVILSGTEVESRTGKLEAASVERLD